MNADVGVSMLVLNGLLAVVCLVIGLHHLGLLVAGKAPRLPAAAHAVMGVGMAAMLAPAVDPVPPGGWIAVFATVAAVAVAAAVRARSPKGEPGHLAVGAAAMLFMLSVGHSHPSGAAHTATVGHHAEHLAGSGGPASLLLTAVSMGLAAWFLVDIVRLVAQRPSDPGVSSGSAVTVADRQLALPHLVMSAAMSLMLLGAA